MKVLVLVIGGPVVAVAGKHDVHLIPSLCSNQQVKLKVLAINGTVQSIVSRKNNYPVNCTHYTLSQHHRHPTKGQYSLSTQWHPLILTTVIQHLQN